MIGNMGFARFAGAAVIICVATTVLAQTTMLDPVRKMRIPQGVVYSTTNVYPQVQAVKPPRPNISENESTHQARMVGAPNNLQAGGTFGGNRIASYLTFPGIGFTGYYPPDCDMGVSPNWVVAVVNTTIAFFKKDGTKVFQQDHGDFFKPTGWSGDILSDPKVFFDPISQRWFTCILEVGFGSTKIGKVLVAVSDDENPNGNWFEYRIEDSIKISNNDYWLDYPGFAVNKDTLVITGNMFPFDQGGYGGNQYIVLPKGPLLFGGSPTLTSFVDASAGTMKVAVTPDPNVNAVFCVGDDTTTTLRMAAIINGSTSNPSVRTTSVNVPSYNWPTFGGAPGPGGHNIDTLDGRIFNAAYRNNFVVAAHPIRTGSDSKTSCRWYQIRMDQWPFSGNPSLVQAGTVSSGDFYSMPAVNIDKRNAISMLFTRSSNSIQADLMYTSRKPTDPSGSMATPKLVKSSEGAYGGVGVNRWGDYFGVAVDPLDDTTFWGHGMVADSSGGWKTFVTNWKVVDIDNATTFYPALPKILQGNYGTGSALSLKFLDADTYNSKSVAVGGLGQVTTWETSFTTSLTPTTADYLAARVNATGPSVGTAFVFFFNWSTNQYDSVATAGINTGISVNYEMPSASFAKYIRSDGLVKMALRAVNPVRNGIMPGSFTFKTDRLITLGLKK